MCNTEGLTYGCINTFADSAETNDTVLGIHAKKHTIIVSNSDSLDADLYREVIT